MAKLDHMVLKNNTYSAAFEGKDNSLGINHAACRLTKWYTSDGKESFSTNNNFASLAQPHMDVHKNIESIIKMITNESSINSDEIVALFKDTELKSKEMFTILDGIVSK